MPESTTESPASWRARPSGLATLACLVIGGVAVTAGYLQWKAPDLLARKSATEHEVHTASATPEARLAAWVRFGGDPQIHNRIQQMRYSAAEPWLVTHAVGSPTRADDAIEIFGIDLADMPRALVEIDGSTVRLRVPEPRRLGPGPLHGDHAAFIPVFPDAAVAPDASERAREILRWALADLARALERDIPGARFVIEVGPEASWSAIARRRETSHGIAPAPR